MSCASRYNGTAAAMQGATGCAADAAATRATPMSQPTLWTWEYIQPRLDQQQWASAMAEAMSKGKDYDPVIIYNPATNQFSCQPYDQSLRETDFLVNHDIVVDRPGLVGFGRDEWQQYFANHAESWENATQMIWENCREVGWT